MKRFAVLGLILAAFALGCTAQQQAAVQGDIAKLQADLQAKKAALVPQLQAGIAYAQKAGDVEWATCQQGLLTIVQSPAQSLPDLSNVFIDFEVARQVNQDVKAGLQTNAAVVTINQACAAWYMREKLEITEIVGKIAAMIK